MKFETVTPDEMHMYDLSRMHYGDDYESNHDNNDEEEDLEPTTEEPLPPAG
jgi:hypothetical protein